MHHHEKYKVLLIEAERLGLQTLVRSYIPHEERAAFKDDFNKMLLEFKKRPLEMESVELPKKKSWLAQQKDLPKFLRRR